MKRNYLKQILAFTGFMFSITYYGQTSVVETPAAFVSYQPICTYPTTGEDMEFVLERRASVKRIMDSDQRSCPTQFNVVYTSGFNAFPQAQAAYQYAVDIWASIIDTDIPINIEANFEPASATNLGSAFSPARFYGTDSPSPGDPVYASALAESIRGQEISYFNPNTSNFSSLDIISNFNSNRSDWFFGIPGDGTSIQPGQVDFITVVLHEIGHGLGIFGHGRQVGTGIGSISTSPFIVIPELGGDGNEAPHIWDTFIQGFDSDVGDFVDVLSVPDPSEKLFDLFTSTTLRTTSPTAISVNNGPGIIPFSPPPIYSPATFNGGSSYSHLDTNTYTGTENGLMVHSLPSFTIIHDPGPVILGFMIDMGWKLCPGVILNNNDFTLEDVNISPNPFKGQITIDLPNSLANESFKISIVDINGRVVAENESTAIGGEIIVSELDNLRPALYFMTFRSQNSDISFTKKIIKN